MKNRFGGGYLLDIKLAANEGTSQEQQREDLNTFVQQLFPDSVMLENFGERSTFKIPKDNVTSLSRVFGELERGEDNKCSLNQYIKKQYISI